jgi:hypothetical protein
VGSNIPAAVSERAGGIFAALECSLRAQAISHYCGLRAAGDIGTLCCNAGPSGEPQLLQRLAQEGSGKQQAAFFNLLLTILKLSAMPASRDSHTKGSYCRFLVGLSALAMLEPWGGSTAAPANASSTASASSSSRGCETGSDTSAGLGLLLLGRCCLQWAAELGHMQAEGADWVQLIRKVQAQGLAVVTADGVPLADVLTCCFAEGAWVLHFVNAAGCALGEGSSSISAGLTAAGYDTEAVLQGCEALAAC